MSDDIPEDDGEALSEEERRRLWLRLLNYFLDTWEGDRHAKAAIAVMEAGFWVGARDGRMEWVETRAEADDLARRWAIEQGGTGLTWAERTEQAAAFDVPAVDEASRCMASLSAEEYKRRSEADGTYDHQRWLWMDGNHERCPSKAVRGRRAGPKGEWFPLCGRHGTLNRFHPYLSPGPTCEEPCCAGEREAQEPAGATESGVLAASESEAMVWSVGIWTPYVKTDPEPPSGPGVEAD